MDKGAEGDTWSVCRVGAGRDGRKVSAEALKEFREDSEGFCIYGDASGVACESFVRSNISQHGFVVLRSFA